MPYCQECNTWFAPGDNASTKYCPECWDDIWWDEVIFKDVPAAWEDDTPEYVMYPDETQEWGYAEAYQ